MAQQLQKAIILHTFGVLAYPNVAIRDCVNVIGDSSFKPEL